MPLAAVEAALARIAEVNPVVNALCLVDADAAREQARALEERRERGEDTGSLTGWTFTVKDAMRQAGYPTTAGSRSLMDAVADASTACVARLEAAGAIAVGRSNVPEFCYRGTTRNELYGQTGNPFAPDRSAGGSSGGAASGVALGVGDLALGSDGGGSVRIPASFCGTVGLKATYGLVPRAPDGAGWLLLTHFGPITRSVADCGRALQVMAGPDPLDPLSLPALGRDYAEAAREPGDLAGLRVAYSDDLGYVRLDGEVRERFAEAVAAFGRATGATLEEAHPGLSSPLAIWNAIACGDNSASEGPLLATGLVGDDARALIEAGRGLSAEEYVAARNQAHEIATAWGAFHGRYDLLLTPTMECVAFPLAEWAPLELGGDPIGEFYDDYCHFCYPFNLTGQPAISLPMAPGSGDLPLGLQIVGRRFEDDLVLRAAAAWERAQPWATPSLEPPARRAAPAEVASAAAAGARVVTIAGVDAWSSDAPVRAGELFTLADGSHARAVRAWSPRAGELEVSFQLEA
ncbi:MAG: aspartyl-tRNA(Asn)/glutamyl-tRNA(Gln) amidotransferase subunit [Gaiellales bacterium]|nr:aspartyl-tRNA(Asn)/glutamyl-tRNA(Gln) amidotransferase subunit [Gaiellales bacterium]